ncbi:DUF1249 domain-containing protein [Microbulbifer hydrolyticus]|uniref:DUF1249 domain-containing protein n=1 Tax=Microbulbifer hydrolyticus TaxID=48074 RepID=A0A6P1T908_9GAMM|nr:DUF1249 domain-containing protein [Microbulbifer hydrolyticus]MBB5211113.1 hypothetical protein [Microbulbifer hydrolyticus]QHQ38103.1 DUF1249 domain-containing protein [Microbulbifer hydrolyticus]
MAVPAGTGRSKAISQARTGAREGAKERYRVDLPTYHADCDANYLRLCKLMPELASNQSWSYQMPDGTLEVAVLERSRYTTEVCLHASPLKSGDRGNKWLMPPPITVRLYHDARMAEVVAVDGQGPVGGDGLNFSYPNPAMHNEDERQQVNRYLSEWLAHCLANGRAEVDLPFRGS